MSTSILNRRIVPFMQVETVSVRAKPVEVRRTRAEGVVRTHVSSAHLSQLADISMRSIMQADPAKATFVEID
jgi:hypothetical protein